MTESVENKPSNNSINLNANSILSKYNKDIDPSEEVLKSGYAQQSYISSNNLQSQIHTHDLSSGSKTRHKTKLNTAKINIANTRQSFKASKIANTERNENKEERQEVNRIL